ncbi:hypothetical protein KL918_000287 [Ogataea parapolymorpha]|uniref:Serine/threonine-protein kinase 19 n=1 Tax=Ogataea parapolymorpha (strain ATCC 26012 / BCRC 20466 / JCM 22074 / NRRL Y-7560 / DL-1) TaxID=871575 RepID=W1Q7I4_OGAPD|nr:hypothetical protein HPODL_02959 [Ogataea parapolymorpha DL-1]ESW96333.1 hypothetical protein HPODL_02959 [Ogataea parapolymorpha DL-1]KAG7870083.1 hypothetical protein KL918_000287 [Ogataea parapolymorpha]KAG7875032.1 hypothetical protein KL916_000644 [Ogataea parapolymorpha]
MAIGFSANKFESPTKAKKTSNSPRKQTQNVPTGEQYHILDYSVNIFSPIPGFESLNLNDLYFESNLEDDDDDRNLEILMGCIEFVMKIKFDFLSKPKLSSKTKAKLSALRSSYPDVVALDQLYAILPNMETFVDSRVEKLAIMGRLKLISHPQENVRYIILTEDLRSLIAQHTKSDQISSRFMNLLQNYPNVEAIPATLLSKHGLNPRILIDSGFLTFSPINEWFTLTLPNLGPFWRLVKGSNMVIYKIIKTTKFEQILEDDLRMKYEANQSNFVKYNGLNMIWSLSLMTGRGIVECFNSPTGRVYKLTGKKM